MHVVVAGAGAWGTALANVAARAGREVTLWARDGARAAEIAQGRENKRYLSGVRLADAIEVTADLAAAPPPALMLFATPAQALRDAAQAISGALPAGVPVVVCAKGIERRTGAWMTEILAQELPANPPAILSGPSFARDVAKGLPTAVTLAAAEEGAAAALADALGTPTFRLYHTDDVRGVEIGGAAKNVLAIASGIVAGRGLGASAHAALVARSFAELARFGRSCGARTETLTGLSGLGDLVLTCNAPQSRNFSLGHALGRGKTVADALRASGLAEGVHTAPALVELAQARGVEMPIAASVDAILAGRIDIEPAIKSLLARPQRAEN